MIDETKAAQEGSVSFLVDLIRTVAMVAVILLHAANNLTIQHLDQLEIFRWFTVDKYQDAAHGYSAIFDANWRTSASAFKKRYPLCRR